MDIGQLISPSGLTTNTSRPQTTPQHQKLAPHHTSPEGANRFSSSNSLLYSQPEASSHPSQMQPTSHQKLPSIYSQPPPMPQSTEDGRPFVQYAPIQISQQRHRAELNYRHSARHIPSPPSTHSQTPNRRIAHILSEQKRRENINSGFEDLKSIVPSCRGCADSKAVILKKAFSYIQLLESEVQKLKHNKISSTPSAGSSNTPAASPVQMTKALSENGFVGESIQHISTGPNVIFGVNGSTSTAENIGFYNMNRQPLNNSYNDHWRQTPSSSTFITPMKSVAESPVPMSNNNHLFHKGASHQQHQHRHSTHQNRHNNHHRHQNGVYHNHEPTMTKMHIPPTPSPVLSSSDEEQSTDKEMEWRCTVPLQEHPRQPQTYQDEDQFHVKYLSRQQSYIAIHHPECCAPISSSGIRDQESALPLDKIMVKQEGARRSYHMMNSN